MNKKMVLMAVLLVNMVVAIFGTDFEERITEKKWYRDYFNEVIYGQDRNLLLEYQPRIEKKIHYYDDAYDDMIFWFDDPSRYRNEITWNKLDDSEYGFYISIGGWGNSYKAKKVATDLYELELEDVRISQEWYEFLLEYGHDMKFALDATEPEYSLYFRFDGEYLYIYLEDGKTLYATYCAYDESEEEALYEAIKTNEFDMTKITFPRHADGTCDYESGRGVPGKKIVNGVYRAQDNLRLRANENTSGEIITTMQAGSLVLILSKGREETIDGITDNWVEVELQWDSKDLEGDRLYGKTGWCFGGYLK